MSINKYSSFILAIFLFVTCFAYGQTKPNIVIILADDLGYGCTGPYGAPTNVLQTPAINSLAEAGMKFTNAYAPASLCSPSRYAFRAALKCYHLTG